MGSKQSTEAGASTGAAPLEDPAAKFDWGEPPEYPPDTEVGTMDLALQSWAYCRAKPNAAKHYRSDGEEKQRRAKLTWRKRASFIELDCGEDSFFVSNTYKTIGVADGIGGWKEDGFDATVMSNSIMRAAKLFTETHRDELDPQHIMQSAFDKVVHEKWVKGGSTTACIASLRQDPAKKEGENYYLDVANLGDSGLMVVRNRRLLHRVHEKVHNLSSPFQLSIIPSFMKANVFADRPEDCIRESVPVKEGDVIVMGTDGLFDNRFNSAIAADAGWVCTEEENILYKIPFFGMLFGNFLENPKNDYVDPYRVTQRLVNDAFKSSVGKGDDTPWAVLLRDFGVKNIEGGKVDDITLLLAKVITRADMMTTDVW